MKIQGLDLDNSPLISQDKALRYAKNIAIGEGNQSYINEDGFELTFDLHEILRDNYAGLINNDAYDGFHHIHILGTIPTNVGVVLFCILNDEDPTDTPPINRWDAIIYIRTDKNDEDSKTDKDKNIARLEKIIYTDYNSTHLPEGKGLNFDISRPIHGDYIYNYKNELVITFTEGIDENANETRTININNPVGGWSDFIGGTNINPNIAPKFYHVRYPSSFNLIPDVIYPKLNYYISNGGNIKTGAYQIAIAFKLNDKSYTNYSILTPPIVVHGKYGEDIKPNKEVNYKLAISFDNTSLKIQYSYYKLAIVHCIDTGQYCYETEDIEVKQGANLYYIINLNKYNSITLDDIFIKNISYIREKTLVNYNNRLIRGNVQTLNTKSLDDSIDKILENFEVQASFRDILKTDISKYYMDPYFKYGESYLLYVGFIDYKGDLINIYNIPNTNENNKFITGERIPSLQTSKKIDFYINNDNTNNTNNTELEFTYSINELCNPITNSSDKLIDPTEQYLQTFVNDNVYFYHYSLSPKQELGIASEFINISQIKAKYSNGGYIDNKKNYNIIRIKNTSNSNIKLTIKDKPLFNNTNTKENNNFNTSIKQVTIQPYIDGQFSGYKITSLTDLKTNDDDANIEVTVDIEANGLIDIMIIYSFINLEDTPDGITIKYDSDIESHYIPRYKAVDLSISLNKNAQQYIPDYVKSIVYFSAEHNMYNSRILTQGLIFPNTDINNYQASEQKYEGQFAGNNTLRFYSFEYLFNKIPKLQGNIKIKYGLGSFLPSEITKTDDKESGIKFTNTKSGTTYVIDRSLCVLTPTDKDNPEINNESKIDIEGTKILDTSAEDIIPYNNVIYNAKLEYTPVNNVILQNNASDSFFKIMNKSKYDINIDTDNNTAKAYIGELINQSSSLYSEPNDENIQVISSIININSDSFIPLKGDTYFSYLTLRLTTPSTNFVSESSNDPDLDSNNTVYRWILTFPIESRFNLNARYGENVINKPYFLHNGNKIQYNELFGLPYNTDNFINTDVGKGYNTIYNENGIESFDIYDNIPDTYNHPHRIIRSLTQNPESTALNWRTFKTDDYKDLPFNRGEIISLKTDNKNLYIQQKYGLHLLQQRDQLNNDDANNSYLGTSDLFNMEPKEIVYSPSGYIGCESYFDTNVNVAGYVVIDAVHKKIFLINGDKPLKISNIRTREYFEKLIDASLINPYNKQGRIINYNEDKNILYITQINGNDANSKTMSFSPLNKTWVSFHTYIPDLGFVNRNGLFWGKNGKLYQPNSTIKGKYWNDTAEPSVIQFILNENTIYNKLLKTIVWKDQVSYKGDDYIQHFFKETINHIMVHNFDQCSGQLDVDFNNDPKQWWNGDTGTNKINLWRFNKLFDLVTNPDRQFMINDIKPDYDNLKWSNSKPDYKWYDVNRFICQFIYLTMWCDNTPITKQINDNEIKEYHEWELIDVHPEWQLDNRNDQTYGNKDNNQ